MDYNLKGTAVLITQEIREYLGKRLGGLDKFLHDKDASRADVELEYSALWDGPKYRAEVMLHEPGQDVLRAEARGTTLHEAIDLTVDELFREVTHSKKRQRQVFRHSAVRVKEFLRGWRNKI